MTSSTDDAATEANRHRVQRLLRHAIGTRT